MKEITVVTTKCDGGFIVETSNSDNGSSCRKIVRTLAEVSAFVEESLADEPSQFDTEL